MKRTVLASLILVAGLVGPAIANDVPEFRALQQDDGANGVERVNLPHFERTYSLTGTWQSVTWTKSPFKVAAIELTLGTGGSSTNVFRLLRTRTTVYDGVTNTWTAILLQQGWTNATTVIIEPPSFTIDKNDTVLLTNTIAGLNVTISAGKR